MEFTYKPVTRRLYSYKDVPLYTPVRIVDCPRLDACNQEILEKYLDRQWEVFARNPQGLNSRTVDNDKEHHWDGNIIIWYEFVGDKGIFQL